MVELRDYIVAIIKIISNGMDYTKTLHKFLNVLIHEGGSDLHLSSDSHPTVRVDGVLLGLKNEPILTSEDTAGIALTLLGQEDFEKFKIIKEADFSYQLPGGNRFRCNAFYQRETVGITMRLIPKKIRSISELNLPPMLENFARMQQGFFLVVGPVGQGKTTTLAALLEMINQERTEHIVTIEDPIEYIFEPNLSLIDQREVHLDTKDFATALRASFRQDIDVLLVGEMRGPETIAAAVTAAETGHLVFSTLHTNDAAQTINRIIDTFPHNQQSQIRLQLATSLAGIFSQRLLPRIGGGRIPAYELMITNKAISNLIRESRSYEINTVIETSARDGMVDMNHSLAELVASGQITQETAYRHSLNPKLLDRLL